MNIKGIIKATKLSLEETQVVKTFSKASTYIQYEQNKNDLEDIYNKIVEKYLEDAPTLFEMFSEQIGHLSEYVRDKYRGHGAKHVSKKRYDELMGLMNILLNDPILETYEKYKGLDGVFNHIMENVNDSINDILNYYLSMKKDFKDGNVVKALRKIRDENIYNTLEKYNGSDDVKTVIDIIYNSLDVKTEHVDKIVKIIGNIKDDGNKKNVFKIISLYVSKTETIENSETDEYEKVGSIDDYFEKELGNALTRIDSLREKGKLELLECVIPYVNRYVISGGLLNVLDVYADNPGVIDMLVDLPNKGEFKMGRLGGAVDQAAVRGTYDFFTNYLIKEYLIKNKLDEEQLGWICRAAYVATKEEKSSDDEQINNCEYYVANLLSPIIEERIKIKKDISTKYDSMKEQEIQKIKN